MAAMPVAAVTSTVNDLRKQCEANPVGANCKRVNGTLDLRNAKFQDADLGGLDLTDVDLWGANSAARTWKPPMGSKPVRSAGPM